MLKKYNSVMHMQQDATTNEKFLFAYKNNVYDLTSFVDDHPGGRFSLQTYKGQDLEKVLFNASIHRHSQQILSTLEQYKCGFIEVKQQKASQSNQSNQGGVSPLKLVVKIKQPPHQDTVEQQSNLITEDNTNQSNITKTSNTGTKQNNLLSPAYKSILKKPKQMDSALIRSQRVNTVDSLLSPELEKSQKLNHNDNLHNTSASQPIINLIGEIHHSEQQIIKEEDESQFSPSVLKYQQNFDLESIYADVHISKIPILNYELVGILKNRLTF